MSTSIGTNTVRRAKSPFEDFLHRASNAGLHIEAEVETDQTRANSSGNWEVVNESHYVDEQDKDEWVLVGKTEGEKTQECNAKQRADKRAKQVIQH
ncbi:hypothetical protein GT037_011166 [Alternaria burnsii]|uniref:Uncharacterized protein n=1 Tax=Alternaria burnsii TaxID=1187904 RepID=A0A8H7EAT1_9PLEO|nr:uncharacterized protein GT037_011166 [Alternaria burnsii]KAF7670715.1 hypothetical protein GT037_011166 [Alternaria burnsii]